jgi:lipopolysaccharide/colanic/teichoic acid biosynthesis glycosyltransferase
LALLIVLAPLIAILSLAVFLFSDRGDILEAVECSGFQNIPFLLLRFRTRHATNGTPTAIGELLWRFHLASLPQLFNVVRGEMALFGPRPVHTAFTQRLKEILPFYAMRLSVKPGLVSWAPADRTDELARLEYDLYYIKHGSPQLDLEILLSLLSRGARLRHAPGPLETA